MTPERFPTFNALVAVEGIDASGKATLCAGLNDWLGTACNVVTTVSFPQYDTPTGRLLLGHLRGEWACRPTREDIDLSPFLNGARVGDSPADAYVRQALMSCNRYESQGKILGALRDGPVILDRWYGSSVAYGVPEGIDLSSVMGYSSALITPDLWLILDVDPALSMRRRPARDLNESDGAKLRAARAQYLEFAASPDVARRAAVIDAAQSPSAVLAAAKRAILASGRVRHHLGSDSVGRLETADLRALGSGQ